MQYTSNACFRLANPKFTDNNVEVDASKPSSYFERLCLQGKVLQHSVNGAVANQFAFDQVNILLVIYILAILQLPREICMGLVELFIQWPEIRNIQTDCLTARNCTSASIPYVHICLP